MIIRDYVTIARPSHWFKNAFVLPGTVMAAVFFPVAVSEIAVPFALGMASVCLISSAGYVINEWLDAEFDRFHPVKKTRPAVVAKISVSLLLLEYALLSLAGLGLAACVSGRFFMTAIFLLVMGLLYNVKPFRTKDKPYLDVLSESVNNPIRLTLGWFMVTSRPLPPSSLLLGYWSGGAFLMAVKRYAELRFIGDPETAARYRHSFKYYTEERLLISAFFYAMLSAFFLGVFLVKHRIELLISLPFLAVLFAWYLHIGMKPNSPVQHPERLYQERLFAGYVILVVAVLAILLFIDVPWLHMLVQNALVDSE